MFLSSFFPLLFLSPFSMCMHKRAKKPTGRGEFPRPLTRRQRPCLRVFHPSRPVSRGSSATRTVGTRFAGASRRWECWLGIEKSCSRWGICLCEAEWESEREADREILKWGKTTVHFGFSRFFVSILVLFIFFLPLSKKREEGRGSGLRSGRRRTSSRPISPTGP